MSSDLNSAYTRARRLVLDLRGDVQQLEMDEMSTGGPSTSMLGGAPAMMGSATAARASAAQGRLTELAELSGRLEREWRQEAMKGGSSSQEVWRRKVEQVAEDLRVLRGALEGHRSRMQRRKIEERDRAELLRRVDVGGEASRARAEFDVEGQMVNSVQRSKRALAEALGTGTRVDGSGSKRKTKQKI